MLQQAWGDVLASDAKTALFRLIRFGVEATTVNEEWEEITSIPRDIQPGGGALVAALVATVDQVQDSDLSHLADDALARLTAGSSTIRRRAWSLPDQGFQRF